MARQKKPIYETAPPSLVYRGYHYVLGAEGEGAEEAEEKEEKKPARSGSARARVDLCKGGGVMFDIEALVHGYDGAGIPFLKDGNNLRSRKIKVKRISKLSQLPTALLKDIEDHADGEAVMKRVEKLLKIRPNPPLYYISASGGWNWSKRNGHKDVEMIQKLLEYLRGRRAIIYSYCNNKLLRDGGNGGFM